MRCMLQVHYSIMGYRAISTSVGKRRDPLYPPVASSRLVEVDIARYPMIEQYLRPRIFSPVSIFLARVVTKRVSSFYLTRNYNQTAGSLFSFILWSWAWVGSIYNSKYADGSELVPFPVEKFAIFPFLPKLCFPFPLLPCLFPFHHFLFTRRFFAKINVFPVQHSATLIKPIELSFLSLK